MNKENTMYFMVYGNEDGMRIKIATEREILDDTIDEERDLDDFVTPDDFLNMEWERGDWEGKVMIIQGRIIRPRPISTVTEWEL